MSEESGKYEVSSNIKFTAISERSKLLFSDPAYRSPSPAEITTAIRLTGLSSAEVGKIIGVDPRNVRRYKSGQIKVMPYAVWRILILYLGLVSMDDIKVNLVAENKI